MTQEKRENFMFTKDTIFYKKLLGLMLPMMLQNLMLALVAVADAFMLGGMQPELHVGSFACHADSVYPEYASFCCNRRTGDSRGTVLGQGKYQNTG